MLSLRVGSWGQCSEVPQSEWFEQQIDGLPALEARCLRSWRQQTRLLQTVPFHKDTSPTGLGAHLLLWGLIFTNYIGSE